MRELVAASGAEVGRHGVLDGYAERYAAVSATKHRVYWGEPKEVDPRALCVSPAEYAQLARLCATLGIIPGEHTTTPEPRWFLVASMG